MYNVISVLMAVVLRVEDHYITYRWRNCILVINFIFPTQTERVYFGMSDRILDLLGPGSEFKCSTRIASQHLVGHKDETRNIPVYERAIHIV